MKINDEISDELLRIDGFQNIIRKDRTRYGGSVAVYVKNASNFLSEVIWTQISNLFLSNLRSIIPKTFIVTTIYKPESKVEIYEKMESLICKIDTEDKGR